MNKPKPEKAYKNLEFLNSPDARGIRIMSEFVEPLTRFRQNNVENSIVIFGSARTLSFEAASKKLAELESQENSDAKELKKARKMLENSRYYEDTVELAQRLAEWCKENCPPEKMYYISSGGGPGIMEAANKGAHLAGCKSIGLNISLPFEQFCNPYISDELNFEFHYFFMRKLWFSIFSKVLVVMPGGFGTLDEMFEILTLVQTGKMPKDTKIVLYDRKFWSQVLNIDGLLENYNICESDLDLFKWCESVDEMFEEITAFIRQQMARDAKIM